MPKRKKSKKEPQIPPDVLEAIDEAAADLAAETNLTKGQAREMIEVRMKAKAVSAEEAADELEEEEDDEEDDDEVARQRKKKSKSKKDKKPKDDEEDDEEDDDEDDEEDDDEDDERDERPPRTHWGDRPLFGKRK